MTKKKPIPGNEGRRRRAAALAEGRQPKLGRPIGSGSSHEAVAKRKAELRKDIAILMQAKQAKPNKFVSEPRRTAKWLAKELKTKGGWVRDEHGHRVREHVSGPYIRDPEKYGKTDYDTLCRDIEANERAAYGPRKYTREAK